MTSERRILEQSKVIACVGISPNNQQVANRVSRILQHWGYKIVPVNPLYKYVIGEQSYPTLMSVPFSVDIVLIYRQNQHIAKHVDEAIAFGASTIWMPLSVSDKKSAEKAKLAGLDVKMDRCIECAAVDIGLFPRHQLDN